MKSQDHSASSTTPHRFPSRRLSLAYLLALSLVFWISTASTSTRADTVAPIQSGTRMNLTLKGYNYTSRYIDTFSVNGQGGGNLYVSGPTSSGGSGICCVTYVYGAKAKEVTVRWQFSGCMYRADSELASGDTHLQHNFYREVRVQVDPEIPPQPEFFEVHFYPDGRVRAAITDRASPPRLVLSKSREDNADYSRCPRDEEPK
jgi:hypothetical protein